MAELIDVTAATAGDLGFFCYKSKRKSAGYRAKDAWLHARFAEGMRLKLLMAEGRWRGFIEWIPGDFAWRAVHASNYALIHCIWVIGSTKGQGHGQALLDDCEAAACRAGLDGVAIVVSAGNWLAGERLFARNGYAVVDHAPPRFQLAAKRFGDAPLPIFPTDWDARCRPDDDGVAAFYSDQCPYIADTLEAMRAVCAGQSIAFRAVKLESAKDVRNRAPCAYGVFWGGTTWPPADLSSHRRKGVRGSVEFALASGQLTQRKVPRWRSGHTDPGSVHHQSVHSGLHSGRCERF